MTDSTNKKSFASRFTKGGGFKSTPDGQGKFIDKFQSKPKSDQESESSKFTSAKQDKKPFSDKKGIKKSQMIEEMSQTEKLRRKRSQNVFLVRGKDRGRAAWHYVLVDNNKRELFLAATRSGSLDVADYGEVLESGWGEDPPESVVKRIEEEFNL